ncbi:MAG: hypothetical protein F4X51_03990 [Gemmatimonadetes bacterium]|nr:hypothetical protein [Gemmatimonadota bacterium]
MNNLALSFCAQSLDNHSPDPMEVNKHLLAKEDVAERQDLAQKISEVSLNGTKIFSENSHSAFLHGDKFLLATPIDQLDEVGRIAPILCYGQVPDKPPESWPGNVVNALVSFVERIGRTISDKNQEVARLSVEALIKKKRIKEMRQKMAWWAVLLIVLCVVGRILWAIFLK